MAERHNPIFERRTFALGATIFREGEVGRDAYIVQTGKVEISKETGETKLVLGLIGANTLFGEMALIDEGQRMATATAVEPTTCFVISRHLVTEKLAKSDRFLQALVRTLVENVRSLSEKVAANEKPKKGDTVTSEVSQGS